MKFHRTDCPYRGFDAGKHCRACPDCDARELEDRCECRRIE